MPIGAGSVRRGRSLPLAHCDVCCLRLKLTKIKTLPKHYGKETYGLFSYGAQKECNGSGTTRHTADRDIPRQCRRPRSRQICPSCRRTSLTLNRNGRFPKHLSPDGTNCSMSEANNRR